MGRHYDNLCREIERGYPMGGHEFSNEQRQIHILNRKVVAIMADVSALEAIVAQVVSDDAAAATEIAALAETVKSLSAGQTVDQGTIDTLTSQLTSATQALSSSTAAAEAPAAPADPAPADAPAADAAPVDAAPATQDAPSA